MLVCGRGTTCCEEEGKTAGRKKGVGTLKKKNAPPRARASRPPRVVIAACGILHKEKGRYDRRDQIGLITSVATIAYVGTPPAESVRPWR